MRNTAATTLACPALALALAACSGGGVTEIVVTIDTSFAIPCALNRLVVEASAGGEPAVSEIDIADGDLPGSLTLLPARDSGDLLVTVTGYNRDVPLTRAEHTAAIAGGETQEIAFLLDATCPVDAPCQALAAGSYDGLSDPAARPGCGLEAYAAADTLAAIRDACDIASEVTGAALTGSVDGEEVPSPLDPPLPFPFWFYGVPVDALWIGDNGYLGLGAEPPGALVEDIGDPRALGGSGFEGPGILPFWDKLKTGPRGVCLAVSGEAPSRILWLTWRDACFLEGSAEACGDPAFARLNFSVGLEETSNKIYLGHLSMQADGANEDRARGATAVIGITSGAAPGCPAEECDQEGRCAGGAACGYTQISALRRLDAPLALELVPQ